MPLTLMVEFLRAILVTVAVLVTVRLAGEAAGAPVGVVAPISTLAVLITAMVWFVARLLDEILAIEAEELAAEELDLIPR